MKLIRIFAPILLVFCPVLSCQAQTDTKEVTVNSGAGKVEVYYFHYTRRCATCNAVESVSREAVSEFYGNKVSFTDYNLDEKDGEEKSKEFDVSGQTLLIVAGETKINITNEGFMNARNNPEKLKQLIKEKIDPLL